MSSESEDFGILATQSTETDTSEIIKQVQRRLIQPENNINECDSLSIVEGSDNRGTSSSLKDLEGQTDSESESESDNVVLYMSV